MIRVDPGSFRDPAGGVLLDHDRIYRYFTRQAAADFNALLETGLLDSLARDGAIVDSHPITSDKASEVRVAAPDAALVVEHPRVPFVSYVYEWPFEMLQAAAIRHLDTLHVALENGFILKDATPYNVQYMGPNPLLIDVASFERYQEGQPWLGYTQFCRTFLNPLLLQALTGVPFQDWMRSSLEGIDPAHLSPLLSIRHKLRREVLLDVVLQAWLNRRFSSRSVQTISKRSIPRSAILGLVNRLSRAIARLRRRNNNRSPWIGYEDQCPYDQEALVYKERFVEDALAKAKPQIVWDLGCNRGRYSVIASRHADYVVAMDSDEATVGAVYDLTSERHSNILPLVIDFLNPSPEQGWAQVERRGLIGRGPADYALCLALVHHLSISGNVPLGSLVGWLALITRAGVVEFVPKEDPMVQTMLKLREDIFPDYSLERFLDCLGAHATVKRIEAVNGRQLIWFSSNSA